MDGEFQFGVVFILVAAILILILLIDAWFKERRKTINEEELVDSEQMIDMPVAALPPKQILAEDLIVINIIAKNDGYFASYDLLQAISATGMQYGAMNIFHYYEQSIHGKISLFNLASATEPGEFDLNHIGDLTCKGLTLFMNIRQVPDAFEAFELMLGTAEQLADDLEGDLYTAHRAPWSDEIMLQYHKRITNYQAIV